MIKRSQLIIGFALSLHILYNTYYIYTHGLMAAGIMLNK